MTLYPQGPRPRREKRVPKPLLRGKNLRKPRKRLRKQRKTTAGQKARTADKLFSLIVRARGVCQYHGLSFLLGTPATCAGPAQTCHIVSRTYRSVRWDENNAYCMCAGAHRLMTNRPLEWERFVTGTMGAADFEALKIRALKPWNHDIEGVLVRLAARAVSLGIKPEGK